MTSWPLRSQTTTSGSAASTILLAWVTTSNTNTLTARPVTRKRRHPLCPWCRLRHPYGEAEAFPDDEDKSNVVWRCVRCASPIDAGGDCSNARCCGRGTWKP